MDYWQTVGQVTDDDGADIGWVEYCAAAGGTYQAWCSECFDQGPLDRPGGYTFPTLAAAVDAVRWHVTDAEPVHHAPADTPT